MNRSPPRPVTEDDIRTFEGNGVVCLGPMFDADWVARIGAAIEETPGRYDTRNFVWPVNDAVRELVFDSPLGEIAASVMRSTTASYLYDNFWVKEPHSESLTPWHQDQPYLQISGRQICNLWIGVDRATEDNGAVEFVRGSHSWGHIFEPEPFDGSAPKDVRPGRERVPDFDNLRDAYDIIHFVTEPGDCIASHALMVHGAGPNRTDRVRRAISFNLFGDDARYALIPPGRGMEISLDYGLSEGDPFPPDHQLAPRIWPKRARTDWPRPTAWRYLSDGVPTSRDEGIPGEAKRRDRRVSPADCTRRKCQHEPISPAPDHRG